MSIKRKVPVFPPVTVQRKRTVETFKRLVKIDSESLNEKKMGDYLIRLFRGLDYSVRQDRAGKVIGGNCGNIYISIPGKIRKAPPILLNAHIDTVVPGRKIRPKVRKGIVVSDGSTILGADDKAGVTAIVEAVRTLREKRIPHGDVQVLFTVAEEIGLRGAKQVNPKWIRAKWGYAVDGGMVQVVHGSGPSQDAIEVDIIGRSAHAGVHPERGIHAIQIASRAIARMRLGRIDKETTSNIGIISGGVAANIIPDRVHMVGEARSRNILKLRRQVHHMESVLAQECSRARAHLKLKVSKVYRSFVLKPKTPVMEVASRAISRIGLTPHVMPTGGGSDAHIFNLDYGIPTAIVGVGSANIHTKQESVPVDNLVNAARLVVALVMEAAKER